MLGELMPAEAGAQRGQPPTRGLGVVLPSARAAPIDMTFAVEPGSNVSWNGRLPNT